MKIVLKTFEMDVAPVLALILSILSLQCQAQEYYVTPTPPPNLDCPPEKPCHTLSYYASNASLLSNKENVSLVFLDGNHTLGTGSEENLLPIEFVQILFIKSFIGTKRNGVSVVSIQFYLYNIYNLYVENMNFFDVSFSVHVYAINYAGTVAVSSTTFVGSTLYIDTSSPGLIEQYISPFIVVEFSEMIMEKGFNAEQGWCRLDFRYYDMMLSILSSSFEVPLTVYYSGWNRGRIDANITNSNFLNVEGSPAIHLTVTADDQLQLLQQLKIESVSFIGNDFSGLFVEGPMDIIINGSKFINNSGSLGGAINVSDSRVSFIGDSLFLNNSGNNGGAIHLSNSTILLEEDSSITFKDNRASEIGGAISSEPGCAQGNCFYSLTFDVDEHSTSIPVSIVFENNTAVSGSDIYGAGLQNNCEVTPNGNVDSCKIQNSIFTFLNRSASSVATSPKRVCLCDENDEPQCANIDYIFYSMSAAPGEKFNLSVILVGEDFGGVAGGVYASNIKQSTVESDFTFGSSRNLQLSEATENCTLLEYSIEPKRGNVESVSFILSRDRVEASKHQDQFNKNSKIRNELTASIQEYNDSGCIIILQSSQCSCGHQCEYSSLPVWIQLV